MSFLYYFPGRRDPVSKNNFNEADKDVGLDSVLRDASIAYNDAKGPDGGQGMLSMIVVEGFGAERLAYLPDEQDWRRASEHHWIGWYPGDPPTSDRLKRSRQIRGEEIVLEGMKWTIPVCGPGFTTLPQTIRWDLQGEWRLEVINAFKRLMDESSRVRNTLKEVNEENYQEIFKSHMEFCTNLMAVNYHVGRVEVSLLDLLNTESFKEIMRAGLGSTTIERQAGKEAISSDTST